MKFNLAAAAITGGVGLAVLLCGAGVLNMIFEGYGQAFIDLFASIYPGYEGNGSLGDLAIGSLYATFDGMIGGLGFAWLYNLALSFIKKPN